LLIADDERLSRKVAVNRKGCTELQIVVAESIDLVLKF
jgi:hypothetical protein